MLISFAFRRRKIFNDNRISKCYDKIKVKPLCNYLTGHTFLLRLSCSTVLPVVHYICMYMRAQGTLVDIEHFVTIAQPATSAYPVVCIYIHSLDAKYLFPYKELALRDAIT